jgi:hypothetical protein
MTQKQILTLFVYTVGILLSAVAGPSFLFAQNAIYMMNLGLIFTVTLALNLSVQYALAENTEKSIMIKYLHYVPGFQYLTTNVETTLNEMSNIEHRLLMPNENIKTALLALGSSILFPYILPYKIAVSYTYVVLMGYCLSLSGNFECLKPKTSLSLDQMMLRTVCNENNPNAIIENFIKNFTGCSF